MPTVFTHALVGGCLNSLAPSDVRKPRLLAALLILPVIPDLDVVAFQFGIGYGHPLGHRGFTHSIVFALLAAGIATWVVIARGSSSRSRYGCFALLFVATLSHGVLDAFTDAGLGIGFLIPFDDTRYFSPWRPIATSPLSVSAFFDGPALRILANEAIYVGIPCVVLAGVTRLMRGKRCSCSSVSEQ